MSKFITPVSMKVTEEQFDKDLKEPLKKLGFTTGSRPSDYYNILVNNYLANMGDLGLTTTDNKYDYQRYYIKHYNPKLFLALAAMTDGEDWIVGEYLVLKTGSSVFQCKSFEGCNSLIGYAGNEFKIHYRKATKEEIINHFNNKTVQNDEFVLPEKWYVCPKTNENLKLIKKHFNFTHHKKTYKINNERNAYSNKGLYNFTDGYFISNGHTEITMDQFKQYVMNKDLKTEFKEENSEDRFKVGDWIISPTAEEPCADQIISINSKYYVTNETNNDTSILGFNKYCETLRLATQDEIERSPHYKSNNIYKGDLEGFPSEIVKKMLERQVEQGNTRDISIFIGDIYAERELSGFDWCDTVEGLDFWSEVIENKKFDLFFKKYPKNTFTCSSIKPVSSIPLIQTSFLGQIIIPTPELEPYIPITFLKSKIIKT